MVLRKWESRSPPPLRSPERHQSPRASLFYAGLIDLNGVSRKSVGIRIQVSDAEKEELLVSNTSEISPE